MSIFPSILTSYTNPNPTDRLNAPSHAGIESAQNSGISQLEAVIGVEGNASVVGTLEYLIKSPASNGGGHVQTANTGGTGQTAYMQGDILVAQSSSVLSKLAISTVQGYALVADNTQATGIKWGLPGNAPTVRVYSINGAISSVFTWAKPSVFSYIAVQVQGPGGAGASVLGNNQAAKGGGAGGYAFKILSASVLGATEQIMVGNGGLVSGTNGSVFSSFGISNVNASIVGNTGISGTTGSGISNGGAATGGIINIQGGSSKKAASGITNASYGGDGGEATLGFGGSGGVFNISNASSPQGFGSGGGGTSSDGSGTTSGPTAGANGVVIVTEY